MKYITIILLITIASISNAQNLALHTSGIGEITIGRTLDISNKLVQHIAKHPLKTKIVTGSTDVYDYYFWDTRSSHLKINDSINVKELFIGTDKKGMILGLLAYINIRDTSIFERAVEKVWGPLQYYVSSGAEGQTYRFRKIWYSGAISLTIKQEIGMDEIEFYVETHREDIPLMDIYISDVLD